MPVLDTFVTVVIPLHNCAAIVEQVVAEIGEILRQHYAYYEIVLIENGSSDHTLERCRELVQTAVRLRVIPLSRHMHKDVAITAGLDAAIGDYVVVLNPNWDPPTVIPELISQCRDGYDVVVGISDKNDNRSWLYRTFRTSYYSTIARVVPVRLISGMTYLLAISRQAVNGITSVQRKRRFLSVLIADIGYRVKTFPYSRINRTGEPLSPSFFEALREGTSLVVHNSNAPMRMVSLLGLVGSFASMAYACYVIAAYLFQRNVAPGWATISLITSFLFLIMFLMLLLVGEYIGRLVEEMPGQPLYHVVQEIHSPLIDFQRRNIYTESTGFTLQPGAGSLGGHAAEKSQSNPAAPG